MKALKFLAAMDSLTDAQADWLFLVAWGLSLAGAFAAGFWMCHLKAEITSIRACTRTPNPLKTPPL